MVDYDLTSFKKVHFTGIKGIAMAALAVILHDAGYDISGSDLADHFPSDEVIRSMGITVTEGFRKDTINEIKPDLIIYTGAHNGYDNPEVIAGRENKIPTLPHGQALGWVMKNHQQLSVAGCHGKTTTSAMAATILTLAKKEPSYAVGCGTICPIGLPGHQGSGTWFVAEADEYVTDPGHDLTPRFLWQAPDILIITNIEYDHPDVYASLGQVQAAYQKLADKVSENGNVILNGDDDNSKMIHSPGKIIRVGFSRTNDFIIGDLKFSEGKTDFTISDNDNRQGKFELKVPGKHNAVNAAMAAVAANLIGLDWITISEKLARYCGTKRKFEKIGEFKGLLFYDDYAHHPSEIQATLQSARLWFPKKRIITVFQPHTYSRTKALISEFSNAFKESDMVIISDIYSSAREKDTLGMHSRVVAEGISRNQQNVRYIANARLIEDYLRLNLKKGDIVLFMGAGDIYNWGRETVKALEINQ